MSSPTCIFCRIASGSIPADKVLETDDAVVFRDISPKAPVHLLAIPKRHAATLAEATSLAGPLLDAIARSAKSAGVQETGYRVVLNQGADAGQEVEHIHFHVLGGRKLSWPPG